MEHSGCKVILTADPPGQLLQGLVTPEGRQRALLLMWGLLLALQIQGKLGYFYDALAIGVAAKQIK